MAEMTPERRGIRRDKVRCPVRLRDPERPGTVESICRDLSSAGALLEVPARLLPHVAARLSVTVYVPRAALTALPHFSGDYTTAARVLRWQGDVEQDIALVAVAFDRPLWPTT
ncbi:MAG: PilZ domain-containing protein [Planctomycetaceae bacterium]|nr:PilZ domain-containing protein [Planctomycetaceae bacterium]